MPSSGPATLRAKKVPIRKYVGGEHVINFAYPCSETKSGRRGHGWSAGRRSPSFWGGQRGKKAPSGRRTPGGLLDGGRVGVNYNNPRRFLLLFAHTFQENPAMRWFASLVTTALCLVALTASAEEKFVPLFNGKNLDGWEGDPDLWHVAAGEIVGSTEKKKIPTNSFLATKKHYKNFVLKLKFKLGNHNSGIQFRSKLHDGFVVIGYQADIADNNSPVSCTKKGAAASWPLLPFQRRRKKSPSIFISGIGTSM